MTVPAKLYKILDFDAQPNTGNFIRAYPFQINLDKQSLAAILVSRLHMFMDPRGNTAAIEAALSWEDMKGEVKETITAAPGNRMLPEYYGSLFWVGRLIGGQIQQVYTDLGFICYNSPTLLIAYIDSLGGSFRMQLTAVLEYERIMLPRDDFDRLSISQKPNRSR